MDLDIDLILNKLKKLATYLVLIMLMISCTKENALDCFKTHGKQTLISRSLQEFDKIEIYDNFQVQVVPSSEYKIEISAGENITKSVETVVNNKTLEIRNNNKCNFVRGYKRSIDVTVHLPFINHIFNRGVSIVTIDEDFAQDSISVRVGSSGDLHLNGHYTTIKTVSNGNGDMYVSGTAKVLYVYTNGINFVNTEKLKVTDFMFIHTESLGDCFVNADSTQTFAYNIQKTGNIYFSGTPANLIDYSEPTAIGKAIKK